MDRPRVGSVVTGFTVTTGSAAAAVMGAAATPLLFLSGSWRTLSPDQLC